MTDALNSCMICGDHVFSPFWVCTHCAEIYGLGDSFAEWPEWAKRMKADHQEMRRQERERLEHEITTDPSLLDDGAQLSGPLEGLGEEIQDSRLLAHQEGVADGRPSVVADGVRTGILGKSWFPGGIAPNVDSLLGGMYGVILPDGRVKIGTSRFAPYKSYGAVGWSTGYKNRWAAANRSLKGLQPSGYWLDEDGD